jgi:regulator of cell morphogenesis and NO signaling
MTIMAARRIAKMHTSQLEKVSDVSAKLLNDHEQIRVLLRQIQESLHDICHRQSPQALQQAQKNSRALSEIMKRHSGNEEKIIFPALAVYHPVLALEAEHDELTLQQAALMSGIMNYSFPEDCTNQLYNQYIEFLDILQRHLIKEEEIIFPLLEQSLSPEEKQHLLDRMEK